MVDPTADAADPRQAQWDASYSRRENFVFVPEEQVVRFAARFVRRRVGVEQWEDQHDLQRPPKVLDLCCGIGRHAIFFAQAGCDVWACDLSDRALETARQWAAREGCRDLLDRLCGADAGDLPFDDGQFDFVICHGSLDSMPLAVARLAVNEAARVLAGHGRIYLDLISGDDGRHPADFAGEEVIRTPHENGTVQTYFNESLVRELVESAFTIDDLTLVRRDSLTSTARHGRWHVIAHPRAGFSGG